MYKFAMVTDSDVFFRAFTQDMLDRIKQDGEMYPERITMENIKECKKELESVEYIFSTWGMLRLTKEEIAEYFPSVRAVFYAAGSVQHFAKEFLQSGIKVFSSWAANAVPVAEYSVAQIILANKGFFQTARIFKEKSRGKAGEYSSNFKGNYGAKLGLLGIGMIGKEVVKLLKPYNFEVLGYDPFLSLEQAEKMGIRLASLDEIFSTCTVISNHIANNEQTQRMLTYNHFSKMDKYATFINTGRGAQLIEKDLVRALREEPTRTAVLDVTHPEPPEYGHDFYELDNVILTPHIAGSMSEEVARMGLYMLEEYIAFADNKPTRYEVTEKMLETMA